MFYHLFRLCFTCIDKNAIFFYYLTFALFNGALMNAPFVTAPFSRGPY